MAIYELLRPAAELWYAYHLTRGAEIPHPRSTPSVAYAGSEPLRVLLVGNGPAHGWGVLSHEMALTGALAREVRGGTGRGARVDYVGEEMMSAAAAPAWLRRADLKRYDAVVVVMGMSDSVRMTPVPTWTQSMRAVLDLLRGGLAPEAPILVAEVQRVRSVLVYDSIMGSIAQRHAHRLNEATRALVADFDATWMFALGEPLASHGRTLGSTAIYEDWAGVIAESLVPLLPIDSLASIEASVDIPALRWAGFDRAKQMASEGPDTALARITAAARKEFKVPVAGVSLLDDDEVHYLGAGQPVSIPSEHAHCIDVVESGVPLVVQHSSFSPKYRNNPVIGLTKGEFYAGHPLVSSTGETIGSFCLMGTAPRRMSPTSMARLEQFAALAQLELWKLEGASEAITPEAEIDSAARG